MKRRDSLNLFNSLKGKGERLSHGQTQVFFGNQWFQEKDFPKSASFVHQVHGNDIVEASFKKTMADGHFTEKSNQSLFIQTADCLPVFISSPNKITALHIGWRGLMKKIFTKSVDKIDSLEKTKIFIGPHIHTKSFQLNTDLTNTLLSPHNLKLDSALEKNLIKPSFDRKNHYYVNLKEILKMEIRKNSDAEVIESSINTYTSPYHYSHRRNPWRIGRNFSFIVKL